MKHTRDKERKMFFERLFYSLHKGIIILLVAGGMMAYLSAGMFITSFKPANDFEDLQEIQAEEGMHIKGDVKYALDCFAYEETWKENSDGSRTPAKTSHYYYLLPGNKESFIGLEVSTSEQKSMEALVEETIAYLESGEEPTTKVTVEGRVSKMDEEMKGLYESYLKEVGYTNEDIAAMGEPLYIEKAVMKNVRIMFVLSVVLIILGVVLFVVRFKKSGQMVAG